MAGRGWHLGSEEEQRWLQQGAAVTAAAPRSDGVRQLREGAAAATSRRRGLSPSLLQLSQIWSEGRRATVVTAMAAEEGGDDDRPLHSFTSPRSGGGPPLLSFTPQIWAEGRRAMVVVARRQQQQQKKAAMATHPSSPSPPHIWSEGRKGTVAAVTTTTTAVEEGGDNDPPLLSIPTHTKSFRSCPSPPPDLAVGEKGNDGGGDGPPLHSLPSLSSCWRAGGQWWRRQLPGGHRLVSSPTFAPSPLPHIPVPSQGEVDDGDKARSGDGGLSAAVTLTVTMTAHSWKLCEF